MCEYILHVAMIPRCNGPTAGMWRLSFRLAWFQPSCPFCVFVKCVFCFYPTYLFCVTQYCSLVARSGSEGGESKGAHCCLVLLCVLLVSVCFPLSTRLLLYHTLLAISLCVFHCWQWCWLFAIIFINLYYYATLVSDAEQSKTPSFCIHFTPKYSFLYLF